MANKLKIEVNYDYNVINIGGKFQVIILLDFECEWGEFEIMPRDVNIIYPLLFDDENKAIKFALDVYGHLMSDD